MANLYTMKIGFPHSIMHTFIPIKYCQLGCTNGGNNIPCIQNNNSYSYPTQSYISNQFHHNQCGTSVCILKGHTLGHGSKYAMTKTMHQWLKKITERPTHMGFLFLNENTLRVNHFCSKKVVYNIIVHNKLKS